MIANLLPGFRELRAPLAAGYLWLLVVWLIVEPHLPGEADKKNAVVNSIIELGEAASPVAIAVAVTFTAFVVGSLSEVAAEGSVRIGEWASRGAPTRVTAGVKIAGIEVEFAPSSSTGSEEAVATLEAETEERIAALRVGREGLLREIDEREAFRDQLLREHPDEADALKEDARIETVRERVQSLEEDIQAEQRRLTDARSALEDLPIPSRILNRFKLSPRGHRAVESQVRETRNAALPRLSAGGLSVADALGKEMEGRIADTGTVTSALFAQTLDELDLTRTRLIGDQPELFSAIDRPRAEAEFRFALVPPLTALVITITALSGNLVWLLGLIVCAALFVQGVRRSRAAGDLIADALYLGRVQAPVLERLERAAGLRPQDGEQGEGDKPSGPKTPTSS